MTNANNTDNHAGAGGVFLAAAASDERHIRALRELLARLAITVHAHTIPPEASEPELAGVIEIAKAQRISVILLSPHAEVPRSLARLGDTIEPDKLVTALVSSPRRAAGPRVKAAFEFRVLPIDLSKALSGPARAALAEEGFQTTHNPGTGLRTEGLLDVLGVCLTRPGLSALGRLDPIVRKLETSRAVGEINRDRIRQWLEQHPTDPAEPALHAKLADSHDLGAQLRRWVRAITQDPAQWAIVLTACIGLALVIARFQSQPPTGPPGPAPPEMAAPDPIYQPPLQETRLALVIGINDYSDAIGSLENPINDARLVARHLEAVGFTTTLVEDEDRTTIIDRLGDLSGAVARANDENKAATVLVYFAGHGIQYEGENYLLPRGARVVSDLSGFDEAGARRELNRHYIPVDEINDYLPDRTRGANILIIDACRNTPALRTVRGLTRAVRPGDGLVDVRPPNGTFIGYSTGSGEFSNDGRGNNSPFAEAFVAELVTPGRSIHDMFYRVRQRVEAQYSGQRPNMNDQLDGPFYFVPIETSPSGRETK